MEFDKKEILKALTVIQKVCQSCIDCDVCPLRSKGFEDDTCALRVMEPEVWKLNEGKEKWRAFI